MVEAKDMHRTDDIKNPRLRELFKDFGISLVDFAQAVENHEEAPELSAIMLKCLGIEDKLVRFLNQHIEEE